MAERNCPRCTLFNPADATNCAACDMKLPPAPPPAAPLSPAGGEDFSDFDAVPVAAFDINAVAVPPPRSKPRKSPAALPSLTCAPDTSFDLFAWPGEAPDRSLTSL